ncbi:CENP-B protein, partial [Zopfia rhizophila CBS 207.26]
IANYLLAKRSNLTVGVLWPHNFFNLVRNFKAKHGITNKDTYNFDETGFQMGVSSTAKVVTGSEQRSQPKAVQPGNREWVTVIQGVNSQGWPIPPFIIFAGVYHLSCWYEDLLPGWAITMSENGWTINEIGAEWLEHFDMHTKNRTVGVNRLLILDDHESHESLKFQLLCKKKNILTLYMPSHTSHLLQPLDVGCFAPLKRAYREEVDKLVRNHIFHVTKLDFLPLFKAAYLASITESNIRGGF